MQFGKYFVAWALSACLAEATEHSPITTAKEPAKQTVSKESAVIRSQETPKATVKYGDNNHGYENKDYDSSKSTHVYEDKNYDKSTTHQYKHDDYDTTKVTHEMTKTDQEYNKETHKSSVHSMYTYEGHHNTSDVQKETMKHMMTSTATSTNFIEKSTITIVHSEATYMADHTIMMDQATTTESIMMDQATTTESVMMEHITMTEPMMMDTTSSQITFDVFTMGTCTDCITAPLDTALATASVSAQDFTIEMTATSATDMAIATPTLDMQSALTTPMTFATGSAPSAGFATTSRAVFTGSAGRQSVDYAVAVALSALIGVFMSF